ncbi:glycosyltransferase [Candidatus Woesearchaeota archaeon]|nr:glycosyltransferase [Candidatus Woesearchaeota archaeon]
MIEDPWVFWGLNGYLASYIALALDEVGMMGSYVVNKARGRDIVPKASELERSATHDPKSIALMMPLWRKHKIIGQTIDSLAELNNQYPPEKLGVFFCVYPNDTLGGKNLEEVINQKIAEHDDLWNFKLLVNDRDGPTTKGQNLNAGWRQIRDEPWDIIALQDGEDKVEPLSLQIYNSLIGADPTGQGRVERVQLPVLPHEPRRFGKWISKVYGDDFNTHHWFEMVQRSMSSGFVPSAGVGTAYSKGSIDALLRHTAEQGWEGPFDEKSLVEDYKSSAILAKEGLRSIFIRHILDDTHDRRPRRRMVGTIAAFPRDVGKAIRQRSRWSYGINFDTWERVTEEDVARYAENNPYYGEKSGLWRWYDRKRKNWMMRWRDKKAPIAYAYAGVSAALFSYTVLYDTIYRRMLMGDNSGDVWFPTGSPQWYQSVALTLLGVGYALTKFYTSGRAQRQTKLQTAYEGFLDSYNSLTRGFWSMARTLFVATPLNVVTTAKTTYDKLIRNKVFKREITWGASSTEEDRNVARSYGRPAR